MCSVFMGVLVAGQNVSPLGWLSGGGWMKALRVIHKFLTFFSNLTGFPAFCAVPAIFLMLKQLYRLLQSFLSREAAPCHGDERWKKRIDGICKLNIAHGLRDSYVKEFKMCELFWCK